MIKWNRFDTGCKMTELFSLLDQLHRSFNENVLSYSLDYCCQGHHHHNLFNTLRVYTLMNFKLKSTRNPKYS